MYRQLWPKDLNIWRTQHFEDTTYVYRTCLPSRHAAGSSGGAVCSPCKVPHLWGHTEQPWPPTGTALSLTDLPGTVLSIPVHCGLVPLRSNNSSTQEPPSSSPFLQIQMLRHTGFEKLAEVYTTMKWQSLDILEQKERHVAAGKADFSPWRFSCCLWPHWLVIDTLIQGGFFLLALGKRLHFQTALKTSK